MSEFNKFFEAQYGPAPDANEETYLVDKRSELVGQLKTVEARLEECQLYRDRRNAALYAWQARERTLEK